MAEILTDNFETYTTGELNGQGSWSASATSIFSVETSVVESGTKAVSCDMNGNRSPTVTKTGTALATGTSTVWVYGASGVSTGDSLRFRLLSGTTDLYFINFIKRAGGTYDTVLVSNDPDTTFATGLAANTWHKLQYDWTGGQARAAANGGSFSDYKTPFNAFTTANTVRMNPDSSAGDTGLMYFDNVGDAILTSTKKPLSNLLLMSVG